MSRYSKDILTEAKKLGIPEYTMDKYYNRGLLAWVEHKDSIPGITPENLGMVVVEEFLKTERSKKFTIREELKPEKEQIIKPKSRAKDIFGEEFVSNLPDVESIREWATSQTVQESYLRRYADKAGIKLIEAATVFHNKDVQEDVHVSTSKPGTKRHSWEMKTYHEKMLKEAKNDEDIEFHTKNVEKYSKKIK